MEEVSKENKKKKKDSTSIKDGKSRQAKEKGGLMKGWVAFSLLGTGLSRVFKKLC